MPKQYPLRVNKHRALVLHFGLHPCCLSGSKFLTANGPLMTVEIIITEATRRTQREEMKEETQPRCLSALYCPSDNEGTHERLITRAVEPRGEVFKLISPKRVSRATILHVLSYVNNNKLGGSIQAGSASESPPFRDEPLFEVSVGVTSHGAPAVRYWTAEESSTRTVVGYDVLDDATVTS